MRSELADSLNLSPQMMTPHCLTTSSESATCLRTTWRTRSAGHQPPRRKSEIRSTKSETNSKHQILNLNEARFRASDFQFVSDFGVRVYSDFKSSEFRISSFGFRIWLLGGCLCLRETTFRNFRLHKHFGRTKSSHRGFKVRRLR